MYPVGGRKVLVVMESVVPSQSLSTVRREGAGHFAPGAPSSGNASTVANWGEARLCLSARRALPSASCTL